MQSINNKWKPLPEFRVICGQMAGEIIPPKKNLQEFISNQLLTSTFSNLTCSCLSTAFLLKAVNITEQKYHQKTFLRGAWVARSFD